MYSHCALRLDCVWRVPSREESGAVGGSKPTKVGQAVLELQKQLPKARIVYASATGE